MTQIQPILPIISTVYAERPKLIGNVNEPSSEGKKNNLPPLFLANLEEDVSEQNNLAESHPKKVDELLKLHKEWLNSVRSEVGK